MVADILYFAYLIIFFNCPSFSWQQISDLAENVLHMWNNLFFTKTNFCRTTGIHICCKWYSRVESLFYDMFSCSHATASLCPAVFLYHVKWKLSRNMLENYTWKTNDLIAMIKENLKSLINGVNSFSICKFRTTEKIIY